MKNVKCKIQGVPSDFDKLPFGRQIEYYGTIAKFKTEAQRTWVSQKRITSGKALKEAIKLHGAKEYYCIVNDSSTYRDDTYEFWYKN